MPRHVNRAYLPQYPPFSMPPAPGAESDEEEKIDPKSFYTRIDQIWDQYTFGNWQTRRLNAADSSKSVNGRLIFKACNRVYGPFGPSTDDHTWIDLKSQPLVEFLRSEESLKGVEGLTQTPPGIDARDLFLRLPQLKKLAVEPTINLEDEISNTLSNTHITSEGNPGLGLTLSQDTAAEESEAEATPAPLKGLAVNGVTSGSEEKPKTDDAKGPPAVTEPPLPAPEQLFILLKFIEEHFKDTVDELERLKADGYMSFKLLWTLCVPGSIVEIEDQATEYPMGVRVDSWGYGSDGKGFSMHGVKYAWNGKVFKQNQVSIETKRFKGLMDVNQIPMKILSDQSRARLIERGKLYQKFAGVNHLQYDAFITVSTQQGYVKRPAKGRVMVDATGFYRFNLNASGGPNGMGGYLYGNPPPLPMHHQQYPSPPSRKRFQIEEYKNDESLPEDILCLTPPAHLGWSFTAKTWGLILVENLSEIVFDELAFDQLVLRKEYKKMIKALVETHAGHGSGLAKDLVAGKGGGMVMVLHGKPGTGKTLTAEAISEHLKCPLYMVSSGELGIQAAQLEKHLNDILEMTSAWKAVVLIDEADVFLEARNTHDLARNSLVSVFLRLLEYHTGVLILTTNRIRSFDKAFVSRFSIALHYPDLDHSSRILIWKEFLIRAGVTVGDQKDTTPSKPTYIAYNDLTTLAKKAFNGRVIKQLVRGAQALAVAENEPLELSHILTVLGVTEQFEADWKELEFTEDIKGGGNQEASMYS